MYWRHMPFDASRPRAGLAVDFRSGLLDLLDIRTGDAYIHPVTASAVPMTMSVSDIVGVDRAAWLAP